MVKCNIKPFVISFPTKAMAKVASYGNDLDSRLKAQFASNRTDALKCIDNIKDINKILLS